MKARGPLVVAAGAVLLTLVLVAGAGARERPQRRHVEVLRPSAAGVVRFGEHDGYSVGLDLREPDHAVLSVGTVDFKDYDVNLTSYGAHFHGSLVDGTVRARFGSVGSIALRFRPGGKTREFPLAKNCSGPAPLEEAGRWVGHVVVHGEGGYVDFGTRAAGGELARTFRVRCRVHRVASRRPSESLREAVSPELPTLFFGLGSVATLMAGSKEGGREVLVRAAHGDASPPGAEVQATAFEYQGKMPVSRLAEVPKSPAGSLVMSLPGSFPATATLKSSGPFSGEARYASSPATGHEWTGDLAVQFPGLLQPLTGPGFYTSLCVVSPLRDPRGCSAVPPNWQGPEP